MKRNIFITLFIILSVLSAQELIDGIAAIVGENIILKSEVDQFSRMTASQLGIDPSKNIKTYNKLVKQSLQSLIDENILLEQAKIETIEVKDREVEAMLDQQIENIIFQAGSKENAERMLGSPINKIKRDYRPIIKNRLIVEKLKGEKFSQINITRREIENFYKNYRDSIPEIPLSVDFSQILFQIKPGSSEDKKSKNLADSLLQLLQNGADFSELANQFSDDPASANYGGDLGYITRGGFIKEFEEVAFALGTNEISDVIKTKFGYHIIQLLDRKGENINVRHILITPEISSQNISTIKSKADSVRNILITQQMLFDSAAILFSDDPDLKSNRGKIQRISLNQIQQPEFIAVLDTIPVGKISHIFKTDLGYHILRLDNKYDDSWTMIKNWAMEYKQSNLYNEWITELRSKFNIDIKVDY